MIDDIGMLRLPAEVRFGVGARAAVAEIVAQTGTRALIVTDGFLATTEEFRTLAAAIGDAGAAVLLHSDVPPELPLDAVSSAVDRAARFAPDVVVGYGGGSALDAAKLIALLLAHGGVLPDYYGENAVPGPILPLIAIPTTAGTGSEVTPVAVVSDPRRELKVGISSPHLVPRWAIVDPALTMGAPPSVTAHAGIDAFVHALESLTARALHPAPSAVMPVFIGRNVLTEPLAIKAASLIRRALPQVLARPDDLEARTDMALGSLLAGMAFGAAGTHLSHAIQYPLGAMTHTPHGLGTGALLPYVMHACAIVEPDVMVPVADALGVGTGTVPDRALRAARDIAQFCHEVGLPVSLAEIGIRSEHATTIHALTMQVTRLLAISPLPDDPELIRVIIDAAVAGDPSVMTAWASGRIGRPD